MKVPSLILAALLGTMTYQEVQAVQLSRHNHTLLQEEPKAQVPAEVKASEAQAPAAKKEAEAAQVKKDAQVAMPSKAALTPQEEQDANERRLENAIRVVQEQNAIDDFNYGRRYIKKPEDVKTPEQLE
jgi:hypothetical protein